MAAPGPGTPLLCEAEQLMRAAGAATETPTDAQRLSWIDAAEKYTRAAGQLREPELRIYALEAIVRLNDAQHLNDPMQVELALRELVGLSPTDPAPIFRLAKFEEEQLRLDAAENTLLSARQQHAENKDVFLALSEFYARRAAAHHGAAVEPDAPETPEEAVRARNQPDADGYYKAGAAVPPPVKLREVPAEYPPGAREAGVQGLVVVELKIDENGNVADAKILKSVPMLDEAALAAVRQWRFAPSTIDGRPVPTKLTTAVPFNR
jgi:TonB family protein